MFGWQTAGISSVWRKSMLSLEDTRTYYVTVEVVDAVGLRNTSTSLGVKVRSWLGFAPDSKEEKINALFELGGLDQQGASTAALGNGTGSNTTGAGGPSVPPIYGEATITRGTLGNRTDLALLMKVVRANVSAEGDPQVAESNSLRFGNYAFDISLLNVTSGNVTKHHAFAEPMWLRIKAPAQHLAGPLARGVMNESQTQRSLMLYDTKQQRWINASASCDEPEEFFDPSTLVLHVKVCHLTKFALFYTFEHMCGLFSLAVASPNATEPAAGLTAEPVRLRSGRPPQLSVERWRGSACAVNVSLSYQVSAMNPPAGAPASPWLPLAEVSFEELKWTHRFTLRNDLADAARSQRVRLRLTVAGEDAAVVAGADELVIESVESGTKDGPPIAAAVAVPVLLVLVLVALAAAYRIRKARANAQIVVSDVNVVPMVYLRRNTMQGLHMVQEDAVGDGPRSNLAWLNAGNGSVRHKRGGPPALQVNSLFGDTFDEEDEHAAGGAAADKFLIVQAAAAPAASAAASAAATTTLFAVPVAQEKGPRTIALADGHVVPFAADEDDKADEGEQGARGGPSPTRRAAPAVYSVPLAAGERGKKRSAGGAYMQVEVGHRAAAGRSDAYVYVAPSGQGQLAQQYMEVGMPGAPSSASYLYVTTPNAAYMTVEDRQDAYMLVDGLRSDAYMQVDDGRRNRDAYMQVDGHVRDSYMSVDGQEDIGSYMYVDAPRRQLPAYQVTPKKI